MIPQNGDRHVSKVQQTLNATFQRSIGMTPFELLIGTKMRQKDDVRINEAIQEEFLLHFEQNRNQLRIQARDQILKVQDENRKTYNLRRRKPNNYNVNDLVAIKRVQVGPDKILHAKSLDPYKIIKVKRNNSYDVKRESLGEGPLKTSTCAEFMKPWTTML